MQRPINRTLMCILPICLILTTVTILRSEDARHVSDLRDWQQLGLPIASNWNTGGFTFDWHVEQVRAGYRFLPTVKLSILSATSSKGLGPKLKPQNEAFLRQNKIPLSIRTDNIATILTTLPRLPIALESIPNSPVVWTIKNGVLNDEAIADVFGPPSIWHKAGTAWGAATFLKDMQSRFPNVPYVILADNNEANRDAAHRYVTGTTRDEFGDYINAWKPPADLEGLSLRVRDYAAEHSVDEFFGEFIRRTDAQYNALFAGFNDSLTAWKGRVLTEAYGVGTFTNNFTSSKYAEQYSSSFGHYDGGGGPLYVSSSKMGDFTSSDWFKVYFFSPVALKAEALNPKHFREVFLNFAPGGSFGGYQAGRHAIMTPARYAAHLQWLLWSIKGEKRPVHLRYWLGNANKPMTPYCDTDAARKIVTDAGHPEIAKATEEDYIRPVSQAVNLICEQPVLRKFWIDGKPVQTGTHPGNEIQYFTTNKPRIFPQPGDRDEGFRLLDCDLNTPRSEWIRAPGPNSRGGYNIISINVWGTATELEGDYLVHLWTPCQLDGQCQITIPNAGQFKVDVPNPNSYFVIRQGKVLTLDDYAPFASKKDDSRPQQE